MERSLISQKLRRLLADSRLPLRPSPARALDRCFHAHGTETGLLTTMSSQVDEAARNTRSAAGEGTTGHSHAAPTAQP